MCQHESPLSRKSSLKDGAKAWHKSSGNKGDERLEVARGSQNRMLQFMEGCRCFRGRTSNNLISLYRKSPTTFQYTWSFNSDEAWDSHRQITVFPPCFLKQCFFGKVGHFCQLIPCALSLVLSPLLGMKPCYQCEVAQLLEVEIMALLCSSTAT